MPTRYIFIFCIVVLTASIIGASSGFGPPNAWMTFGMGAIAMAVFFGFLFGDVPSNRAANIRNAIAGSMIVTYLLLVVSLLFYDVGTELPKATEVLLTSFTTTIGIVIASYFGASAYVDAKKKSD
ncbi:MAG: hypothetical protein WCP01_02470 [Methylococcaceae bacterium]|jgi:hypothetical protein